MKVALVVGHVAYSSICSFFLSSSLCLLLRPSSVQSGVAPCGQIAPEKEIQATTGMFLIITVEDLLKAVYFQLVVTAESRTGVHPHSAIGA